MPVNQNQSLLDSEPYFTRVKEMVLAGETNATIAKTMQSSERSIRRWRSRHGLQPTQVNSTRKTSTRIQGDNAEVTTPVVPTEAKPYPHMDDPDAMLRERGLDPEQWFIDGATVNEWDGPQAGGSVITYHQAKLNLKRKRSEATLLPARSDGWVAPPKAKHNDEQDTKLIVVVGDQQAPFQDDNLHALFCEWLDWNRPDRGVSLGDTIDLGDISRHRPDPDNFASLNECTQVGYDLLRGYVTSSPDTEWEILDGNHDERLRNILLDKPSVRPLYGVKRADTAEEQGEEVLTIAHLMRLDELGINYVKPHGGYSLDQIKLTDKLAVAHGWLATKGSGTSALATLNHLRYSIIVGHCFDDVTEILTPDGWRAHDSLVEGVEVATLNRATGLMEFQPVQVVHRYDHFKELVHIEGTAIDLAVTGAHGLWVANHGQSFDWHETTADERFGRRTKFRLAAPIAKDDVPVSDEWLRMAAWIMAEGHVEREWAGVRIAQSDAPDGRLATLERDISACGLRYSKVLRYVGGTTEHGRHRNFDAYRYGLLGVGDWRKQIDRLLTPDKTPRLPLWQMSARQCAVFLDTYVLADGSRNASAKYSVQLASARKDHIDFLQALACKLGRRSSVAVGHKTVYYLTINERPTVSVPAAGWSRKPYDGTVWCVTVPNGTLVVRRNGKTAITLNTHRQSIVYHTSHDIDDRTSTLVAAEAGCMCRIDQQIVNGRKFPNYTPKPDWQQGFSTVTVHPDGYFKVDNATYVNGTLLYRDQQYRN